MSRIFSERQADKIGKLVDLRFIKDFNSLRCDRCKTFLKRGMGDNLPSSIDDMLDYMAFIQLEHYYDCPVSIRLINPKK